MQSKRCATVPIKKYPLWFFKMLINAFICFEKIMMKIIKNYFKGEAARNKQGE